MMTISPRLSACSSCWRVWGRTLRLSCHTRCPEWWALPGMPSLPQCVSQPSARHCYSSSRCTPLAGSCPHQQSCTTTLGLGASSHVYRSSVCEQHMYTCGQMTLGNLIFFSIQNILYYLHVSMNPEWSNLFTFVYICLHMECIYASGCIVSCS